VSRDAGTDAEIDPIRTIRRPGRVDLAPVGFREGQDLLREEKR